MFWVRIKSKQYSFYIFIPSRKFDNVSFIVHKRQSSKDIRLIKDI